MKITKLLNEFFKSNVSGGIVLVITTLISLFLTNVVFGASFPEFWQYSIGHHTLEHWVNDGLMTIFFLLVGLELEREIYIGELSNFRNALFPILAALGGMIVPASIHLFFNYGTATQSGAGIPTATDIAFSLGVLAIFSSRVPTSLKIFLTALAIADDLGAVVIIAIFYTKTIFWTNLLIAFGIYAILVIMGRMKVYLLYPYLIGGSIMWYFMLNSGVHATITGVLLAFAIPFGDGSHKATSAKLQHFLHKPVAFIIIPIFALANTCILIGDNWLESLTQVNSIGIFLGLVVGKPLGILIFCFLAIFFKVCSLPEGVNWKHLIGASILAGIGFTMSIFVSVLAFSDPQTINFSQIVVLLASVVASILGGLWFFLFVKPVTNQDQEI